MKMLILNSPLYLLQDDAVPLLANSLGADWSQIDPLGQLEEVIALDAEMIALNEAMDSILQSRQRNRDLLLRWQIPAILARRFVETAAKFSSDVRVLTFAPAPVLVPLWMRHHNLNDEERASVRRFYLRGCHRVGAGPILSTVDDDPFRIAELLLAWLHRADFRICKECGRQYSACDESEKCGAQYLNPPWDYSAGSANYCLTCWLGVGPDNAADQKP